MRHDSRRSVSLALLALVALLVGSPPPAVAGGTTGGLAVAVSPDGSRVVAGGSNRVLYELDPATLEVKRRVYLGRQVMDMAFSPDGTVLAVESTKAVQLLKADTLEPFQTWKDAERMTPVPSLGAIAVLERGREPAIRLYGFADGKEKAAVPYDRMQTVAAFGFTPDGKKMGLLYSRRQDASEEKVAWNDIPEELKKKRDANLREYQQRHDGYAGRFLVLDVATGKPLLDKQLWFSTSSGNTMLVWRGDHAYVVGYSNQNAKISKDGQVTYFELGNSFNYAFAPSADGAAFWTGGLRAGTRTTIEGLVATPFEVDALEGFPEYYKNFSAATDGTAFAGTTSFRVAKIDPSGKLVKVAPVY